MRVAPRSFVRSFHVSQRYIHTPDEADAPIHYTQLTVIAIVHFAGESRETYRHKSVNIYSAVSHTLKESAAYPPTAHVVVNETHLYALASLVDKSICDEIS